MAALLEVCAADATPARRRDGALVAILYGACLRRAEVCGLDLADFDGAACALTMRAGKGRRDHQVFLTRGACRLMRAWVTVRGEEDRPVAAAGRVHVSRLGGESVHYVLKKATAGGGAQRHRAARPQERRMVYRLLEAGVDVFTVQQLGHADAVTTAARYTGAVRELGEPLWGISGCW